MKKLILCALIGACLAIPSWAGAAGPDHTVIYPRLICVVPIIGSGTMQDPSRPLFAPMADTAADHSGRQSESSQIIAFQSVPTDDGKAAIVVFVARSYAAFGPILQDPRVIRCFDRNRWKEDDLIRELQKYKKNFDIKMLRIGAL